jgi:hypothetical protein
MKIKLLAALTILTLIFGLPVAASSLAATRHFGMCDASAAVFITPDLFVIANDEDNLLRIFSNSKSGESLYSQDISSFLQINPKHPEADIEGATRIKDHIYWITSHGSSRNGKNRPNRHRFFATEVKIIDGKIHLQPVGKPFSGLIKALDNFPELKDYNFQKAAKNAPESRGGLNIEGLTRTPQGHLLIGFRNPVPQAHALLIPLENPQEVVTGTEKPKLGHPIHLALNGLGIRSIEYSDTLHTYFIIAGPYDDNGNFQLYQWSGNTSEAPQLISVNFQGLRPEALVIYPHERRRIQIISDDGAELINGQNCKGLAKAQDKSFRSLWVNITP